MGLMWTQLQTHDLIHIFFNIFGDKCIALLQLGLKQIVFISE